MLRLIKNNSKCIMITTFIIIILSLTSLSPNVLASRIGLSTEVILPDTQIGSSVESFDLLLEPGQEEVLQLRLVNTSSKDIISRHIITTATSDDRGVIIYRPRDNGVDPSIKHRMDEVVSTVSELKVPANGSVILNLYVTMPDEEFSGLLLGGVAIVWEEYYDGDYFEMLATREISLRNDTERVGMDFALDGFFFYDCGERNSMYVNIRNTVPTIARFTTIAHVLERGEIVNTRRRDNMQMAPNSYMGHYLGLDKGELPEGAYLLQIGIYSFDGTWSWNYNLQIIDDEPWLWERINHDVSSDINVDVMFPETYEQMRDRLEGMISDMLETAQGGNTESNRGAVPRGSLAHGIIVVVPLLILLIWIIKSSKKENNKRVEKE